MMLAVLLFLFLERPVTIITTDNRECRMLVNELNADWFQYGINQEMVECHLIQQELIRRVRVIDSTKPQNLRYSYEEKYPIILYGEAFNQKIEIDAKAYQETSWAMRSLYVEISNMECDLQKWKDKCNNAKMERLRASSEDVLSWLAHTFQDEYNDFINEFYGGEFYGDSESMYDALKEKYSTRRGFPTLRPLYLPPSPILKHPWENKRN